MLIVVAAALEREGAYLLQKRPPGKNMAGLWEFPGGKLETGETPETALRRELAEELGIAIDPGDAVPLLFAEARIESGLLLLLLYLCRRWEGEPRALHASEIAWVAPETMRLLPMPPADTPFIDCLAALGARSR